MQIPSEVLWTRTLGINLAHGKIWYSPMAFNGIFCANIYTGKTMPISDLNVLNEIYKGPKFSYVIRSGHYFYFCPYQANYICEVNFISGEMKFYDSDYISAPHVSNVVCTQDKLYMFCNTQPQIIIFDLTTKEISVIKNTYFTEKFAKGDYFAKDVAYSDTSFFITDDQKIIKLNIRSQEVNVYDLSQYTLGESITTIAFDGMQFWLMCDNSEIIGWDENGEVTLTYKVPKLGHAVHSIINGSNLYIFFADNNYVMVFNLVDRKASIVEISRGYCWEQGEKIFFHPFIDIDNAKGVYIYTFIEHKIVYLEPEGDVSYIELFIDKEDTVYKEIYAKYLQRIFYPVKGVLQEQKDLFYYNLESYLKGVTSDLRNNEGIKDRVGEKIYYIIDAHVLE